MTKQISPLRQRMIDDMAFRNMSPNTQKVYAYAVANFARLHRQSSPYSLRCEATIPDLARPVREADICSSRRHPRRTIPIG